MNLFLNYGFAWISILLTIALSIIYILKKVIITSKTRKNHLTSINKLLRKHHKLMGILLVVAGLIHGYFSSESILSLNLGTAAWIISVLLGLNYMARKTLSKYRGWIYYHMFLTVGFILFTIFHVIQVGGIQAHKILLGSTIVSGQKAMDSIPQSILDNQSPEVNATSGATFTSIGIMNAVNDALSQALINGTLPITQQLPENRGHGMGDGGRQRH